MKKLNFILLICFSLSILSCGPRVTTQKTTSKNLGAYETFAFLPNADVNVGDMELSSEDVSREIVETVNNNLIDAGYTLNRQDPDLLALISTETDTELETTTDPVYVSYPYNPTVTSVSPYYSTYYYPDFARYNNFVGYDIDTYTYKEGTVIIYLVDRKTKNTVWKGVASESIGAQSNFQEIRALINAIFEEYPITK